MSADARLDMEVNVSGTDKAARGLDDVAQKTVDLKGKAGESGKEVGGLTKAVSGLSKVTAAAKAAQASFAAMMRGDFVGAFRSATQAVRLLWAAMISNPFTAVLAAIGLAIAGVLKYMDHVRRKAEEAREIAKEYLRMQKEIAELAGKGPTDMIQKTADKLVAEGNRAEIEKRQKAAQGIVDWNEKNAQEKAAAVRDAKIKKQKKELTENYQAALEMLSQARASQSIWNEALDKINRQKTEQASPSPIVEIPPVDVPNTTDADAVRAAQRRFDRRRQVDAEPDQIKKYRLQLRHLEGDLWQEGDEVKRIGILEKMYEIEKRITEEKQRQKQEAETAAQNALDEATRKAAIEAKAADDEKRRHLDARRAMAGTSRTTPFGGLELADGWKVIERSRNRTLAGGRAAQWFDQRNRNRLTAQGIEATRTTEMGQQDIGKDGKTNPAERTNQLLEKVVERLQ